MIELIKRKLAAGFTLEEAAEDPFAALDLSRKSYQRTLADRG